MSGKARAAPASGRAAQVETVAEPRGLYRLVRAALFRLEAERAHEAGLAGLRLLQALAPLRRLVAARARSDDPRLRQTLLGTAFGNPLGLAAGFDKDGRVVAATAALGFGFVELGTVTPRPQPGNPRPRLFRHAAERSLQNCLGFNNRGAEALAERLGRRRFGVPVGVNLGRNKQTPPERVDDDYGRAASALAGRGDYFVVNVSSPNTPGLRALENRRSLAALLERVGTATAAPVLVKLSPDLDAGRTVELATAAVAAGAAGIVLTNTTTDYSLLPAARPEGGLSGAVLRQRSFERLAAVARELAGRSVLVSVGGIDSAAEAYRRLRHGASLVQLYTALVYQGPALPARIVRGLSELLRRDGANTVQEVVGADL